MKELTPSILAMYLGANVFVPETNKIGRLEGINWVKEDDDGSTLTVIIDVHYSHAKDDWDVLNENDNITRVKPILRRLSTMTDAEVRELIKYDKMSKEYERITYNFNGYSEIEITYTINAGEEGSHTNTWTWRFYACNPKDFAWLLSKHFDLFGLIDNNLAVDAQTVKK